MSARVIEAVKAHGRPCFTGCGAAAHNVSSACFIGCLFETLDGMSKAAIVAPFEQAFHSEDPAEGGCAEVPPCPPPCNPPPGHVVATRPGRWPLAVVDA